MGSEHRVTEEQPKPLYHTTKSAAKALEEMVANEDHDAHPLPNHAPDYNSRRSRASTKRPSGSVSNSTATSSSFSMLSSLSALGPPHGKGKEKASHNDQVDNASLFPALPALPRLESQHQEEGTPPYHPLPPLPQTPPSTFESPARSKSAHRTTHTNGKSTSRSSSKKRRGSSSLPGRLLDALKYLDLDTDLPPTDSPTDSHPHAQSTSRIHTRTRSADSVSTMLYLTTERLTRETARANDAERQAGEILSNFRSANETRTNMERELVKVREELGLYKVQLDAAQKEIYRAQEIVDRVDRERVQAEDEARKLREKIRKLVTERAMEQAMEEGRRLGYEEGLRQGRASLQLEGDEHARRKDRSRTRSGSTLRGVLSQEETTRPLRRERSTSVSHSNGGDSGRRSSSTAHTRSHSRARPGRESPPDVGRFNSPDPVPVITTPAPTRVPSTQPQPQQSARGSSVAASSGPEDIAVWRHDSNAPIHPIPIRNNSASALHPPLAVPPDNYIPILNADSTIHLPPPHDLSNPPPITPTSVVPPPPILHLVGKRPASRAAESSTAAERRQHPPPSRGAASRAGKPRSTMSVMSGGSTRLSSLDLLSPPDDPGPGVPRNYANPLNRGRGYPEVDPDSPTMASVGLRKRRPRASTQPEKMVEQWRSMHRVPQRPTSPSETVSSRRGDPAGSGMPYGNPRHQPAIERPTSAEPIIRPGSAAGARTPSRQPREIVLPVPMSGSLLNNNTQPNRSLHQPAVETQVSSTSDQPSTPPPQYERSPHGRSRSASTATMPAIEVVTPSSHTQSTLSHRTQVDPILLTPESASRPVPLPPTQPPTTHVSQNSTSGFYSNPNIRTSDADEQEPITMVLPDNNLPAGFVPLSPIPGMANLNPYPPGFAPTSPKPGNFIYPTSPLLRM